MTATASDAHWHNCADWNEDRSILTLKVDDASPICGTVFARDALDGTRSVWLCRRCDDVGTTPNYYAAWSAFVDHEREAHGR